MNVLNYPGGSRAPLELDAVPRKTLTTRDGVRIAYWVVGDGPKTLLLANGLGGRLYAWAPLVEALHREYRLITWDYRGLFQSSAPERRLGLRPRAMAA